MGLLPNHVPRQTANRLDGARPLVLGGAMSLNTRSRVRLWAEALFLGSDVQIQALFPSGFNQTIAKLELPDRCCGA